MKISSNFDSGNVEVVNTRENGEIELMIRKDTNSIFSSGFILG